MDATDQPASSEKGTVQEEKTVYCPGFGKLITPTTCKEKTRSPRFNARYCCFGKDAEGCLSKYRACRACVAQGETNPGVAISNAGYCAFHAEHGPLARRPKGYTPPPPVQKREPPQQAPEKSVTRRTRKRPEPEPLREEWRTVIEDYRRGIWEPFTVSDTVAALRRAGYGHTEIATLFGKKENSGFWSSQAFALQKILPTVRAKCEKKALSINMLSEIAYTPAKWQMDKFSALTRQSDKK